MVRSGHDIAMLWAVVEILLIEEKMPDEFHDHELSGRWAGVRDVHLMADWLLLYRVMGDELVLIRTGTHRDLFSNN